MTLRNDQPGILKNGYPEIGTFNMQRTTACSQREEKCDDHKSFYNEIWLCGTPAKQCYLQKSAMLLLLYSYRIFTR